MSVSEARLNLVGLFCPGCDCGACVTKAVDEVREIPGVSHVRMDRRAEQLVIQYDPRDTDRRQFTEVVISHGIALRDSGAVQAVSRATRPAVAI